jgi:hypothetical protein
MKIFPMMNQRSIPSEHVVWVAKLLYSRVRKEEPAADAGNERFGHSPLSVHLIKRVVVMRPGVHADGSQIGAGDCMMTSFDGETPAKHITQDISVGRRTLFT